MFITRHLKLYYIFIIMFVAIIPISNTAIIIIISISAYYIILKYVRKYNI